MGAMALILRAKLPSIYTEVSHFLSGLVQTLDRQAIEPAGGRH
jgi:hypothetical protein